MEVATPATAESSSNVFGINAAHLFVSSYDEVPSLSLYTALTRRLLRVTCCSKARTPGTVRIAMTDNATARARRLVNMVSGNRRHKDVVVRQSCKDVDKPRQPRDVKMRSDRSVEKYFAAAMRKTVVE